MKKIQIALTDKNEIEKYRQILEKNKYELTDNAYDIFDLLKISQAQKPDMVIIDPSLPYLSSLEWGKKLLEDKSTKMLFYITSEYSDDVIEKVKLNAVSGCLIRPVEESNLIPAIKTAFAHYEALDKLKYNYTQIEKKIDDLRTIEKAKDIIMKENSVDSIKADEILEEISISKKMEKIQVAKILTLTNKQGGN
ncbi:MAG: response regulator [Synergistaceae bacterium]